LSLENNGLGYEELSRLMLERGLKALEGFEQMVSEGVEGTEMESIIGHIKGWRDTYRTALTSFSCEAVGGDPEKASSAGLMIAFVGAGLAIHDDIIDRSEVKRFRRTFYGLHSSDEALVVGDLLIFKAIAPMRRILRETSPQMADEIIRTFEQFLYDICEGEIMEISCRKNVGTDLEYYNRALRKLGCDVEACTRIGALVGGGTAEEVEVLGEYGKRMGYVVRLADDVKDALNLEGNLPHRLRFESVPLPILYAAKASNENFSTIDAILNGPEMSLSDIEKILELCFDAGAFAHVQELVKKNILEGVQHLQALRPSGARGVLASLIRRTFDAQVGNHLAAGPT